MWGKTAQRAQYGARLKRFRLQESLRNCQSWERAGRVKTAQRRRAVLTRPKRSRTIEDRSDATLGCHGVD